jgi:hypothetical protein
MNLFPNWCSCVECCSSMGKDLVLNKINWELCGNIFFLGSCKLSMFI